MTMLKISRSYFLLLYARKQQLLYTDLSYYCCWLRQRSYDNDYI